LFASADPSNLASIRVMQKAGMTFFRSDQYHVEYEVRRAEATRFQP
jgi:RimJ/RimL family protein N-acetyltransferase